jgi:hypothetical protein
MVAHFAMRVSRLSVEETYIAKFQRIETGGEIRYRDPNHPEYDDMTEADLDQPLVFEICRSFTGSPLNSLQAHGANFWLNEDEARFSMRSTPARNAAGNIGRPWWKFWA